MQDDITLWNGDCLELMKDIPDASVDLILTDLPYGMLARSSNGGQWDNIIPPDKLWEQWKRIRKPHAAIVLFAQGMFTATMMMSNTREWRFNLIWDKVSSGGFLDANRRPLRRHEDIIVFCGKGYTTYNPQFSQRTGKRRGARVQHAKVKNNCYGKMNGFIQTEKEGKYPTSIIRVARDPSTFIKRHPTQKPVALMEYLIRTFSNPHDTVLDCCMGTGATGVACKLSDRKFIGIEQSPVYFQTATERISLTLAFHEDETNK